MCIFSAVVWRLLDHAPWVSSLSFSCFFLCYAPYNANTHHTHYVHPTPLMLLMLNKCILFVFWNGASLICHGLEPVVTLGTQVLLNTCVESFFFFQLKKWMTQPEQNALKVCYPVFHQWFINFYFHLSYFAEYKLVLFLS